jgi:hypothetical protein
MAGRTSIMADASPNFVKGPELNRERIFCRTPYEFPAIDAYVTKKVFPLITDFELLYSNHSGLRVLRERTSRPAGA